MASYVHGTLETDSNDELFGVVPKYLFLMELGHIKEFLPCLTLALMKQTKNEVVSRAFQEAIIHHQISKGKYRVVIWRYGWKGIEDFYKVNVIF